MKLPAVEKSSGRGVLHLLCGLCLFPIGRVAPLHAKHPNSCSTPSVLERGPESRSRESNEGGCTTSHVVKGSSHVAAGLLEVLPHVLKELRGADVKALPTSVGNVYWALALAALNGQRLKPDQGERWDGRAEMRAERAKTHGGAVRRAVGLGRQGRGPSPQSYSCLYATGSKG